MSARQQMTLDRNGLPLALKPRRKAPEMDQQKRVVRWLRLVLPPGSIVNAVQNERGASGRTEGERIRYGAARKASGVLSGVPDLAIHLAGGRVCYVEMKAAGTGRLSSTQAEMHADLRRLGFAVGVATCVEDVRELLEQWGVEYDRRLAMLFA